MAHGIAHHVLLTRTYKKVGAMKDDMKLRLFTTAIVITMLVTYISPWVVANYTGSIQDEIFNNCMTKWDRYYFDLCWSEREQARLPLWNYLFPYLPAAALLWFNWLVKPGLKFSVESYPTRTISALVWIGLLVAALGIYFPIQNALTRELHKTITFLSTAQPPLIFAGCLIAPLLFHHLLAPVSMPKIVKTGKIALLLLALTPIIAFVVVLIREGIRALEQM